MDKPNKVQTEQALHSLIAEIEILENSLTKIRNGKKYIVFWNKSHEFLLRQMQTSLFELRISFRDEQQKHLDNNAVGFKESTDKMKDTLLGMKEDLEGFQKNIEKEL